MKTIKVLISYNDTQLGKRVGIGEVYEVDDARAEQILNTKSPDGRAIAELVLDRPEPKDFDLTPPQKTEEGLKEEVSSVLGEKAGPKRRYGKHRKKTK